MKKIFLAVLFCSFLFVKNISANQIYYGNQDTISRSQVAKMLSFIYFGKDEIIKLYESRNINFCDTDASKWYDKYINAVYNKKLMNGIENKFFKTSNSRFVRLSILTVSLSLSIIFALRIGIKLGWI